MLVNITEHFVESGREWQVGQNPDVPREVAAMWIVDGKATADTDGARNQSPVSGALVVSAGYLGSITEEPLPVVVAHRGSALIYPEETILAYDRSIQGGSPWIEMDVQTSSDGVLYCIHDSTVDRTATGTGSISALTSTALDAMFVDGNSWLCPGLPSNLKIPRFADVLARYASCGAYFIVEDKDLVSGADMTQAVLAAGIAKSRVLLQAFAVSLAYFAPYVAAGWPCMLLMGDGTAFTPANVLAAGIKYVGVSYSSTSQATIDGFRAVGVQCFAYTINRRKDYAAAIAAGYTGVFSDDPKYVSGNYTPAKQDQFLLQRYRHGCLANASVDGSSTNKVDRGLFFSPDQWGFSDSATAAYIGALIGDMSPITPASSFVLTGYATYGAVGDDTRWFSVFIGIDDSAFQDSAGDAAAGYHILFRKSGVVAIFKKNALAAST